MSAAAGARLSEKIKGQLPDRPKSQENVVQMWCATVPDAPREADFGLSHRHDLDFLSSGRRDSNPRPSPWQKTSQRYAPNSYTCTFAKCRSTIGVFD
jgi:hypothetical protein